jgi:WD40 repeat protein
MIDMPRNSVHAFMLFIVVILAACQDQAEGTDTLPTQLNMIALETEAAVTRYYDETANAPTPTATERRPTLPPSFTPTDTTTPVPASDAPTVTPEGDNAAGTIYYIYNGDSIIAVAGDGSQEEFIYTVGMDIPIQDLTPSPDGEWLAFVAPGNGSAREVWIINRDGTYAQQVSCRGMADVRLPTWSSDGEWLAFVATQLPNGPLDIYAATRIGTPCSEGTQRLLADINSQSLGGLAYEPSGRRLFFSNPEIYALDLATGEISPPITRDNGFGPIFSLAFRPQSETLLSYLRPEISTSLTTRDDGFFYVIDVAGPRGTFELVFEVLSATDTYQWSADGRTILMSSQESVFHFDRETKVASGVVRDAVFPPKAVYSPTHDHIAYTDADPEDPSLPQLYVAALDDPIPTQITFNQEGTISDVIWLSGGW